MVPTNLLKGFEKCGPIGYKKGLVKSTDPPVTSQKKNPASSMAESRVHKMEQSKCKSKGNIVSGHAVKLYGRVECSSNYP